MRFFSGKGDSQLLKNTPSGEVNMEAIQTRKERICGLEVVLNRDPHPAVAHQSKGVVFLGIPSLVCRSDIPGEWGVLVLGEDVWERGLKVTCLVINHNLLAGQRRLLLFEMPPPDMLQSFWKSRPSCPYFGSLCTSHSPIFKMGNRSILNLFPALRLGGWRSLSVSSRITTAGSISALSYWTPRVLSNDVWARRVPHCRRATSSGHPSGDLRASCQGQYVGEHPQRSPLHTAEIHPRRERKVRGWSDRGIPRLAVQTAGIGASFPADAHNIRHEW